MASFEIDYNDGLERYNNAYDAAHDAVTHMGLPLPQRPLTITGELSDLPKLPVDLSETDNNELERMIGEFTEWFTYAIGQLKLAEGLRNVAEKKRSFSWSWIRKTQSGTVSDKDDSVRIDARYIETDCEYEDADLRCRLLNGIVEGLKRDIETVSRIVTIREGKVDIEGRRVSIGRKRASTYGQESIEQGQIPYHSLHRRR